MKTRIFVFAAAFVLVSGPALAVSDFMAVDANSDGFVSYAETTIGAPEISDDLFKVADADGDGVLSAAEYTEAFQQMGDQRIDVVTGCGKAGHQSAVAY